MAYKTIPYTNITFPFQFMTWQILAKLKGALSGLRRFLPNGSCLEVMKNGFYFTLKALFLFKIFKFLPWIFGHDKHSLIRKL